jgi:hypothetical protein
MGRRNAEKKKRGVWKGEKREHSITMAAAIIFLFNSAQCVGGGGLSSSIFIVARQDFPLPKGFFSANHTVIDIALHTRPPVVSVNL